MKLTELTQSYSFSPITLGAAKAFLRNKINIYDFMRKIGWEQVGSGAFSDVYSNPQKPYILKN
ncbi:Uncharacterised protein [uncultured archaeon]|nr:Uncharacterised protein [uncultured archaeon]